jgi:PEP-CTERM motif
MKVTRFFVLPLLLVGFSALAYADGVPVDPQMDVSDPQCASETGSGCPTNVGPNQGFQLTVNAQGGGIFMGTNESAFGESSGQWTSLLFTFNNAGVGPISCTSGANGNAPFGSPCAQSTEDDGTVTDLFYTVACSGDTCTSGIPNNDIFTINLNAIIPGDIWPAGLTMTAYANQNPGQEVTPSGGFVTLTAVPTPEPATLTLLGVGIGALAARRRFWRQRDSRS